MSVKPCPFCGKDPVKCKDVQSYNVLYVYCEAKECIMYNKYAPVEAWQSRPTNSVVMRRVLEEIKEEYDFKDEIGIITKVEAQLNEKIKVALEEK